jgi:hypothetical protein
MRGGLRTNGLEIEVITTILIGLARISVDEDLEVLLGSWGRRKPSAVEKEENNEERRRTVSSLVRPVDDLHRVRWPASLGNVGKGLIGRGVGDGDVVFGEIFP